MYLFNLAGYRLFFGWAQQAACARLTQSIDRHEFDEKDLITVRIPLSMPYQSVNKGFEDVSGEALVSGVVYRYVKRKIEHGDLVLLCLPDLHGSRLLRDRDNFFNRANGIAADDGASRKGSDAVKAGAPDPGYDLFVQEFGFSSVEVRTAHSSIFRAHPCCDREGLLPEQPPEILFPAFCA